MSEAETLSPLKKALVAIDKLQRRLDDVEDRAREPIAVVGMGCRTPGAVRDPESFWRLLRDGVDAITEVPKDRWDLNLLYDADREAPGRMYTRYGGFLDEVDLFDARFFGIAPREALSMDPQQRLLLETSWEALERAGQTKERLMGSRTGVYMGVCFDEYSQLHLYAPDSARIDAYSYTGTAASVLTGRLSYALGLQGPSISVDTACSSSLVTVHLACQALRAGECELALAGGVNLILGPENTISFCKVNALSPDGHCKTFDASANGYVRGEGCGVVVLKRLSDALRDGDPVVALVRGSAVNQDGRSNGLTAPNGPSQERVIRDALRNAGVKPAAVGYVEAHGTGTPLGDPIEVQALGNVYREGREAAQPLLIGSVKTNIGHLEGAAGVLGLIKAVLSLQEGQIPPHLHLRELNPMISLGEIPAEIPTALRPWPGSVGERFAGVSAFGISGTNCHVVLQDAGVVTIEAAAVGVEDTFRLLPLSGHTEEALLAMARGYRDLAASEAAPPLADLCYSASVRRSHHEYRLGIVVRSRGDVVELLDAFRRGEQRAGMASGRKESDELPKVVFVFSGQGPQWWGMGRELLESEDVFRTAVESCDEALRPHTGWSVLAALRADEAQSPLGQTEFAQPALFALQMALAALWRSWGIVPRAVVGHSVGEIAAACTAGALGLEQAARIVANRGRIMQRATGLGKMAAVELPSRELEPLLAAFGDRLSLAAVNGPAASVVSGEREALEELLQRLVARGVSCKRLPVDYAFHSSQMEPFRAELAAALEGLVAVRAERTLVSTVTGELLAGPELDARYWSSNVRAPVLFAPAVERLLADGHTAFVELSPHPVLSAYVMECAQARGVEVMALPSLRRGQAEGASMLGSLGALYAQGGTVRWEGLHPGGGRCVTLSGYPWQRERFWLEAPKAPAASVESRTLPLLGRKLRSALKGVVFESTISSNTQPFLDHHRLHGTSVFPAAGYLEMALEAAEGVLGGSGATVVQGFTIEQPLVVPDGAARVVQAVTSPGEAGSVSFEIFSSEDVGPDAAGGEWTRHVVASLARAGEEPPAQLQDFPSAIQVRCREEVAGPVFYEERLAQGALVGTTLQAIDHLWRRDGECLARLGLRPDVEWGGCRLHPALTDAALQLLLAALPGADRQSIYLPVAVERLILFAPASAVVFGYARLSGEMEAGRETHRGEVSFLDEGGRVVAALEGVLIKRAEPEVLRQLAARASLGDWLYTVAWRPRPLAGADGPRGLEAGGSILIFADRGGVGAALATRLEREGTRSLLAFAGTAPPGLPGRGLLPGDAEAFGTLLGEAGSLAGVVHLWSLDAQAPVPGVSLEPSQQLGCGSLLALVQALASNPGASALSGPLPLAVVTRGAQAVGDAASLAVEQAPVLGMSRVVALEQVELRVRRFDLDPGQGAAADAERLVEELGFDDGEDEVAWRDGVRHVSRLVREGREAASEGTLRVPVGVPFELEKPADGVLDHLRCAPVRRRPPGVGEVEIEVFATGLNFRDVLNALGMYPGEAGPLGLECAGRVSAVGEEVSGLAVGDEVLAMAFGSFGSFVLTRAELVVPKPAQFSFAEAATIPVTFLTAWYGLCTLAGMRPGDRVLIHAAAGGVGLSAVQVAQAVGAEIYATAGSPEKHAYLRSLGVRHVFSSRTTEFADQIRAATGGRGVDIVLNSLSGEFIEKSLAVLTDGGRFLEIGKRDVWSRERMAEARPDVAYETIALDQMARESPALVGRLFGELMARFAAGTLHPLPLQRFDFVNAPAAFRYMAQARNIGKVVVSARAEPPLRAEATYVVTGGLGALGLLVAEDFAEHGARHLLLVGRSEPSEAARATVAQLTQRGVRVVLARGDVSRSDDLARIRDELRAASLPPVRGVVHAAGILDDGILLQQDWTRFAEVMAPKVDGAANLDTWSGEEPLDFLVFFSSMASLLGSRGQSNYSAANAFLDALAHRRSARGLRTVSINWGPWSEVGLAAALGQRWTQQGVRLITPGQGLAVLGRILEGSSPQVGVLPVKWSTYVAQLAGPPPPFFAEVAGRAPIPPKGEADAGTTFARTLEAAPPEKRPELILGHVRDQAGRVLGLPPSRRLDVTRPLKELGLDSLMSVELRNALVTSLGRKLPGTLIFDHPTITAIADFVSRQVFGWGAAAQAQGDRLVQRRVDDVEGRAWEPIAVIGIGCRTPGGVRDPESLWQLLRDSVDAITEVPKDRWDLNLLYDADREAPGKMYTRYGGFLDEVDLFDARFFGISPREAVSMDPQHRLLLETSWEALERAGQTKESLMGSRTGVYMGACFADYSQLHPYSAEPARIDAYSLTGTAASVLTGRLSYFLGLQGPSITVDTACSSSLVAVHLACQALRAGECELALAGGVSLILGPENTIYFCKVNALSPDGHCKTFDASANGYVRSDGCGVVVLKRLSDAVRDRDPILALVRGSAVNQDGRSNGLTAPNGPSQERVIRDALRNAGVKPAAVGYVEAHGTGTPLGDPIEVLALGNVYREGREPDQPLLLGSVKTNLGHLEGAAGVLGLIKAVLSLQEGQIPPHLHLRELNPMISLGEIPAEIPTALRPWPGSVGERFAGVSAFGISGTNAHLILQDASGIADPPRAASGETASASTDGKLHVLPLSAHTPEALVAVARSYRDLLSAEGAPDLPDLCYSASVRRSHHEHRLGIVAGSRADFVESLDAFLRGERRPGMMSGRKESDARPKVVFVFPGQGSQWFGMARELMERSPVFRESIARCEEALRSEVSWSLAEQLALPESSPEYLLNQIDVIQPTLFAIQVSLAAQWRSWGVIPDAVVGHSMGEVAASHVAGALGLEDAARIICRRSLLLRRTSGKGAMAAVELSFADAEAALRGYEGKLSIAVSNSSRSTVLSGDTAALDDLLARLDAKGVFCRRVKVDVASHSPQMDPLREDLLAGLEGLAPRPAAVPVYSTVRGQQVDGRSLDARYWVDNLRQPVLFSATTRLLHDEGHEIFVELSPHPVLLPAVQEELSGRERSAMALPSLRRDEGEQLVLLESLCALFGQGYPIDWRVFHPEGGHLVRLSAYPWQRERFWLDATARKEPSPRRTGADGHPFLGQQLRSSLHTGTRYWETNLSLALFPFLEDHCVNGMVVLPAAAYVEMALEAAAATFDGGRPSLEGLSFSSALVLPKEGERTVQVAVSAGMPGTASFRISSLQPAGEEQESAWTVHATGTIRKGLPDGADAPAETALPRDVLNGGAAASGAEHYRTLAERGLQYGPRFQGVQEVWRAEPGTLGLLRLHEDLRSDAGAYQIHPALLDACFQVLGATLLGEGAGLAGSDTYLPVGLGGIRLYERPRYDKDLWGATLNGPGSSGSGDTVEGDVLLLDEDGRRILEVRGLRLERLDRGARRGVADSLFTVEWQPQPPPAAAPAVPNGPGLWLVLAGRQGNGLASAGTRLASMLEEAGDRCVIVTPGRSYEKTAPGRFAVDPSRPEDFRRVLDEAFTAGRTPCRGVAHLWSLDSPAPEQGGLAALEEARVLGIVSVLHLVQALAGRGTEHAPPRLWLVTAGAQNAGGEVASVGQSPLWGLGRVIASEHPELRCSSVDLSAAAGEAEVRALHAELRRTDGEDQVALRGALRYVARLTRWSSERDAETKRIPVPAGDRPFRVQVSSPGVLDNLALREAPRREPGPGQVEIEVCFTGLNFMNVMSALGIYPGYPDGVGPLGIECAGRIASVGEGVAELRPGDEVIAVAYECLGSHALTDARLAMLKPAAMTLEEAATIPIVFLTSYYALHHLARLQRGESVLIHAAAGGVGLAAIQIAQRAGAEVFATAGTPEKRDLLHSLGVHHVMDSRSLDFADQVLERTGGRGVDVVLNSLSGEAIPRSLAALATYGRFLELGKRDIYQNTQLGLAPFQKSLSYFAIDLDRMTRERPDHIGGMFRELMDLFAAGELKPIPYRTFPVSHVADAFRHMAQARHVGKILVSMDDAEVQLELPAGDVLFTNGVYLVTGGLGGLGLAVARWMVDRGARELVLVGRGDPSDSAKQAIEALQEAGARVRVFRADVADATQMARVVDESETAGPLRGVIHAAGILDDGILLHLSAERFASVMAPKVAGAWNLHTLTAGKPVETFVLFSSVASLLGSPGQSNYAAGNAFLDALAHYRRARGLAAISVDWGPWADIGLAAAQDNRGRRLSSRGLESLSPAEGLKALGRVLAAAPAQVAVMPFDRARWCQVYPAAAASAFLSALAGEEEMPTGAVRNESRVRERLLALEAGRRRRALLETHLQEQVAQVLRLAPSRVDVHKPLRTLGLDSLMSLELRNRLEASLGLTLPATLIFNYPTVAALAPHLAGRMEIPLEEAPTAQPEPAVPAVPQAEAIDQILGEIEKLTPEEARRLLAEES